MKRIILLLALAILCSSTLAGAKTLHVPEEYPTIQAAIDAAQPEDNVLVAAGTYKESLHIDKPLWLTGAGRTRTVIQATCPEADVVSVRVPYGEVIIEGLKVCGGDAGIWILVGEGAHADVRDAIVSDNRQGVTVSGEGSVSLGRSALIANAATGLELGNGTAKVEGNEILRGGTGVLLVGGVDVELSNNLVEMSERGIDAGSSQCGVHEQERPFWGRIRGRGNLVYGNESCLCPPRPGDHPWPEGFSDSTWVEKLDEVIGLLGRAASAYNEEAYEEALDAYEAGLSLLAALGETAPPLLQSSYQHNIGIVYHRFGHYEEALASYAAARKAYADRGMDVDVAFTDRSAGVSHSALGRFEEALASFESAYTLYIKHSKEIDAARIEKEMGNAYFSSNRYEEALACYQSARVTFAAYGLQEDVESADWNIACVYLHLGRFEEALAAFQAERDRCASSRNSGELCVAATDWNIGLIYYSLGWYEWAMGSLRSARTAYSRFGQDVSVIIIDFNIANVQLALGLCDDALATYRSCRSGYASHGMDIGVAMSESGIGSVCARLERYEEALESFELARSIYANHGMAESVASVETSIGMVHGDLGRHEEALAIYEEILGLLDQTPPLAGMSYSYASTRWPVLFHRGRAYEKLSRWNEARESYEAAIAVIESIRGTLTAEELKLAWQERTKDVYQHLIDLLYRMGEGQLALLHAERCRARTFLDLVAAGPVSSLEDIAEEGIRTGVVDAAVIESDLAEVGAGLPADTAALEYFVAEEATYLWLVRDGSVSEPIRIKIEQSGLRERILAFRTTIETTSTKMPGTPDPEEGMEEMSRDLYELLIAPVEDRLEGIEHLVIVPSGPLYYLPFCALIRCPDCEGPAFFGGEYLIERFSLSYIPSLTTLKYAWAAADAVPIEPLFLALADPTSGDPQFSRLLSAHSEAISVAELFDPSEVYLDTAATEEVVVGRAASADHILLSTHGSFNPRNPMFSYLLLSPTDESDGRLYTHEVFSLDLHAALVTLSACETLLPALEDAEAEARAVRGVCDDGDDPLSEEQLEVLTAGDEIVGLTRAFLYAGTPSVLSSLWSVVSITTEPLMVAFYSHLRGGMNKAQALRQAQLDVMAIYPHPRYWAAFNLVGDWR